MNSKKTNSEIGSHHWLMTLLGSIASKGEYMKEGTPKGDAVKNWGGNIKEEVIKMWGRSIEEEARELIAYYKEFNKPKVHISFTGEVENKKEFALEMVNLIEKASKPPKVKEKKERPNKKKYNAIMFPSDLDICMKCSKQFASKQTKMKNALSIYAKQGKIKALDTIQAAKEHNKLTSDKWRYTATIDPVRFIQFLANECSSDEIIEKIKELSETI